MTVQLVTIYGCIDTKVHPKRPSYLREISQPLFTRNLAEGGSVERKPELKYLRVYIITGMFSLDDDDAEKKKK